MSSLQERSLRMDGPEDQIDEEGVLGLLPALSEWACRTV